MLNDKQVFLLLRYYILLLCISITFTKPEIDEHDRDYQKAQDPHEEHSAAESWRDTRHATRDITNKGRRHTDEERSHSIIQNK